MRAGMELNGKKGKAIAGPYAAGEREADVKAGGRLEDMSVPLAV